MSAPRKYSGTLTVDASGDGTLLLPAEASGGNLSGLLLEVRHIIDGTSPYANGFNYTVTGNESGKSMLAETVATTATFERHPGVPTHASADGAVGTEKDLPVVANEKIKITVASGGVSKTGQWEVTIG